VGLLARVGEPDAQRHTYFLGDASGPKEQSNEEEHEKEVRDDIDNYATLLAYGRELESTTAKQEEEVPLQSIKLDEKDSLKLALQQPELEELDRWRARGDPAAIDVDTTTPCHASYESTALPSAGPTMVDVEHTRTPVPTQAWRALRGMGGKHRRQCQNRRCFDHWLLLHHGYGCRRCSSL
jgi:hypothetical protein